MAVNADCKCTCCGGYHTKQAFISHARCDEEIASKVKQACCEVGVAPYLFEFSPEYLSKTSPAEVLAGRVATSDFLFVVLGPSVSKKFWIQAWIGFEIGVSKGVAIESNSPRTVIVLQDVYQGIEVTVPICNVLFLFDFASNDGWNQYQGLVSVLAGLGSPLEFYKTANKFRQSTLATKVKCENCKSGYEAWIAKDDAHKLGYGYNPLKENPELLAECTIECPSCAGMVTRCFIQMLPS